MAAEFGRRQDQRDREHDLRDRVAVTVRCGRPAQSRGADRGERRNQAVCAI
jgi:hypothetical protein